MRSLPYGQPHDDGTIGSGGLSSLGLVSSTPLIMFGKTQMIFFNFESGLFQLLSSTSNSQRCQRVLGGLTGEGVTYVGSCGGAGAIPVR